MTGHLHYIIQGYRAETEGGGLADVATVDILVDLATAKPAVTRKADSRRYSPLDVEQYAIEQAAALVHKPNYRVRDIIQHDDSVCPMKH